MPNPSEADNLRGSLIRRFKAVSEGSPDWAWPFNPSIPLVGSRYSPDHSLLVYASAENLSWINDDPAPERFTTDVAWDRYRTWYEGAGRKNPGLFPDVGIQPVTDGGLLVAALFVATRFKLPINRDARAFLETLAVTNWGKFSVRGVKNADYIGDAKRLTPSVPFVVGELAVLRPAIVLVPKPVWEIPMLRAAMRGASPWTRFLPVPQFNATVVNCHLDQYSEPALALKQSLDGQPLAHWMGQLHRLPQANAWRYIALLDELLRGEAQAGDATRPA